MNRRAPLIAAAAAVVLVVLSVFFLVLPKMHQVSAAKDDLAQAQQQEQSLRAQLASLQDAQRQAPQTKREIQKVENEIPPTADLPGLIRLLSDARDRAGVDLFQFAPGAPTTDATGHFSVISTAINVTGSYFSLDDFLFRLENLPRAAKVTNVAITPAGGGGSTSSSELSMNLTVEFYTSDLSAGPGSVPGPTGTNPGA